MKFKRARKVMRNTLTRDEDLRFGYQSNIAMLLHDRHGITGHDERNAAAQDILDLVFGPPPVTGG